jgi:MYXO-CTERM domain-containing protein
MGTLAAIRPDDWNFPLLLHVLGAMLLVGALVAAVAFQYAGWRRDADRAFSRLAFRTLLFVGIPAWFLMRIGAQWIYDKENFSEGDEPAWIGIGWMTAEPGGVLLLLAVVLAGLGSRRREGDAPPSALSRIATVIATLLLIAYVIAVWAMSAKPD